MRGCLVSHINQQKIHLKLALMKKCMFNNFDDFLTLYRNSLSGNKKITSIDDLSVKDINLISNQAIKFKNSKKPDCKKS